MIFGSVPEGRTAIHEPSASVYFNTSLGGVVKFVTVPSATVAVCALKSSTTVIAVAFHSVGALLRNLAIIALICSAPSTPERVTEIVFSA
ncbi:Uncharacterised protein [Streptococcus pneumoniae]|nr:Uncharacterised protein [Streptococcus pneumoniae]